MITTSVFNELLVPGLRLIFGDLLADQWEKEYLKIFDIERSERSFEEYQGLAGLGQVPEKPEGEPTQFEDLSQAFKQTVQNITFSLGFEISKEMQEDDLYQQIRSFPKSLAMSVMDTVDTVGANILNNGFDSVFTFSDGVELFSSVHPLAGGGTFSNESTTPSDLSMVSFEQMLIDIQDFPTQKGLKMRVMPIRLIITPTFEATAKRILESVGDPETANRSINPFQKKLDFTVNHFLTDESAWFVRTNNEGAICQKRIWPAELTQDNDFDTDAKRMKTRFRLAFSVYEPRSLYGNSGNPS